jgi:hypothetical protein
VSLSIQNEAHVDLRPDAAGQQPLIVADIVRRDVDELAAEIVHFGPVIGIDQPYANLVDESPAPLLLDLALGAHRLVGADVVVGQGVVDHLQAHLDRHVVGRGAIFSEQELQHEHRDIGADLHATHQILAHHLAGEGAIGLVVEGVSRWRVDHGLES